MALAALALRRGSLVVRCVVGRRRLSVGDPGAVSWKGVIGPGSREVGGLIGVPSRREQVASTPSTEDADEPAAREPMALDTVA